MTYDREQLLQIQREIREGYYRPSQPLIREPAVPETVDPAAQALFEHVENVYRDADAAEALRALEAVRLKQNLPYLRDVRPAEDMTTGQGQRASLPYSFSATASVFTPRLSDGFGKASGISGFVDRTVSRARDIYQDLRKTWG